MAKIVDLCVFRSEDWVRQRALETGEDVPREAVLKIDVAKLSLPAREVLMDRHGHYIYQFAGCYDDRFFFQNGNQYYAKGRVQLVIDGDDPSVAQIEAALLSAAEELAAIREAEATREAKLAEARQLLAAELSAAEQELSAAKRRIEAAERDCQVLSEFLAAIPQDALRGALKNLSGRESSDILREKIEDAATVPIFGY